MKKRKKKGGKNSKRQKPKVLVLKLEPLLINIKDKHYWKVGATNFPLKAKAFYVNIMLKKEVDGKKKHIMGPYSKKIADSIMTDFLSRGECCWVEEDWIR